MIHAKEKNRYEGKPERYGERGEKVTRISECCSVKIQAANDDRCVSREMWREDREKEPRDKKRVC
jgi:hypothetical protein